MKDNFPILEKIFYKIIFKANFLNKVLFDMEKVFIKKNTHIDYSLFILGLPRSGTTILLNLLSKTNLFAYSTYRNMPLVLSPNIWTFFTKFFKGKKQSERLHKDGININLDSPEAFEEVFWKIFLNKSYIKEDLIIEHDFNSDILEEFKNYIQLICQSKKKTKYLSKNNNNILRINYLSENLENSKFIIMFRDPLNHSASLKTQYFNFLEIHHQDNFYIKYMNFLGHYEFGKNYKNYDFSQTMSNYKKENINYWIQKWIDVYSHLIKFKKSNVHFLSYEKFCENPTNTISQLIKEKKENLDIDTTIIKNKNLDIKNNSDISNKAYELYEVLKNYEF